VKTREFPEFCNTSHSVCMMKHYVFAHYLSSLEKEKNLSKFNVVVNPPKRNQARH
jgi:hypothetical protein